MTRLWSRLLDALPVLGGVGVCVAVGLAVPKVTPAMLTIFAVAAVVALAVGQREHARLEAAQLREALAGACTVAAGETTGSGS